MTNGAQRTDVTAKRTPRGARVRHPARWLLAAALIAAPAVPCVLPVFPVLAASTADGAVVWAKPVRDGERVALHYFHSVNRTWVEERLVVRGNRLVIDATAFASFGAGMPNAPSGTERFHAEGRHVVIAGISRPVKHLDIRVGRVVADHRLSVAGESIRLSRLAEPGAVLRLAVRRLSLAEIGLLAGRGRTHG